MTALAIANALRVFVIVGGLVVLIYGLVLLPRFRPFPEFALTTGLFSLLLAASTNELYALGFVAINDVFNFGLIASVCGTIFTGVGLILIRR